MLTSAGLNLLFRAGLRKNMRDEFKQYPPVWNQIFKTGSIDKPEISAAIFTSFSRMFETHDGEDPIFEKPVMSGKVSAVDKEYSVGAEVSRKAREDDEYGKVNQASKWLAHASRMTYEYRAAAFLDDAVSGTNFKGYDNLPLASASHTFVNAGGTWSNLTAAPVRLSVAGLTAMLDLAFLMKDHNGDPVVMQPDTLIHGNNAVDALMAAKIFNTTAEPFTANNEDNAVKKIFGNLKTVRQPYTTSTKRWFMVDSRYNDAWFLIKRPVNFRNWVEDKTLAALAVADTRFLIWFVDPRGWWVANPS